MTVLFCVWSAWMACSESKVLDTSAFEDSFEEQDTVHSDDSGAGFDSGIPSSPDDEPEEDTGLISDGIHNIAPTYGSQGAWEAGEIGRTELGADIRIPVDYRPEERASPVIWLFNEQIDEWTHTDEDGVILVDLREYNDVPVMIEKLNESMQLLEEGYNVDQGRYYFAGWSAGGNIVVVLGAMNQELIAGTMVFPGTGGNQALSEMQQPQAHKIRLFYACGDQDPAYPWDGVQNEANYWASAFGYETLFVRVEGAGHKIQESDYAIRAQAWEWMKNFNMEN